MIWVLIMISYGWGVTTVDIGQFQTEQSCIVARDDARRQITSRQWLCVQRAAVK